MDSAKKQVEQPGAQPRLYTTPETAMVAMKRAEDAKWNVLFPQDGVHFIPELHALSLRVVTINPDPQHREVYEPMGSKGRYALTKHSLDKIASAANVSWQPTQRVDDGRDPHYVEVVATGTYRTLDGDYRGISARKAIDLRDGAAELEKMRDKPAQVAEYRKHIIRHAEAKARNAALREAFSIKGTYHPEELRRPFIVPKLVFTGRSEDPEVRKLVATMMAQQAIVGVTQLFGAPAAARPMLQAVPPPPVGFATNQDDEDDEPAPSAPAPRVVTRAAREEVPDVADFGPPAESWRSAPPPPEPPPPRSAPAPQRSTPPAAGRSDLPTSMRFGTCAGIPLDELESKDLAWYEQALSRSLEDPSKARYRASTERDLAAVCAELARRDGEGR